MRKALVLPVLALLAAGLSCRTKVNPKPAGEAVESFPLAKGAYWVYRGPTKWTVSGASQPSAAELTWRMEVTEVIERESVTGFIIKGFPGDLCWYEEGKKPGDYLLVRVGTGLFYLLNEGRMGEVLGRLRNPEDFLEGLVKDAELLLDLPLAEGKIFGETLQITRGDRSYCWVVEAVSPLEPGRAEAIGAPSDLEEFTLRFQSRPDHQVLRFVPGVGITGYQYLHHGTVSETDLKLVEWGRGAVHKPKST